MMGKPKCKVCKKKLSLVEQTIVCKCKHSFCAAHRLFSAHACPAEKKMEMPAAATFEKVATI